LPSQLPTKRRKALGNVTNVCVPTSSVVQQMSLPVKEPKKIVRKEKKCPTRVGHTPESETYPGKKILVDKSIQYYIQFSIYVTLPY
jgi:hypothetical protein